MPIDLTKLPTSELEALQSGDLSKVSTATLEMLAGETSAPTVPAPEKPGFLSRTGTNLGKAFTELTTPIQGTGVMTDTLPRIGEKVLRTAGHVGAVAGDAFVEGAKGIYNTVLSPGSKETIKDAGAWIANTDIGKAQLQTVKGITDTYGQAKETYPRLVADIESGANALNLIPAAQLVRAGLPGARAVLGNVGKQTEATLTKKIDSVVQRGIEKAVRPTVVGKRTASQMETYAGRSKKAVETIIGNKDNLSLVDVNGNPSPGLPKTLKQFSEAIEQTKRSVYQQYHDMATSAGESGAVFDSGKILTKLDDVAVDLKYNPEVRKYANSLKNEVAELHGQSPDVIEARIADLNSSLSGFYEGRVSRAKAQVDASVANLMREELDNNIMNAVGPGYQDLKNTYGALKTIEKEVSHRAVVNARKNIKGLPDLTDIFTKGEIVTGVLTANPALIARGTAGLGIKTWIKAVNNPDRIVKGMFGDVEKLIEKRASLPGRLSAPAGARSGIPTGTAWFNADGLQTETGLGPVKSGRTVGEPYGPPPSASLIQRKQLPPGQGFELQDSNVIDVPFTSRTRPIPQLEAPGQGSATLALPAGQGVELKGAAYSPGERWKQIVPSATLESGSGKIGKGPENLITYLEKQGGVNFGKSYNLKELKQDMDIKRISRGTGMSIDEVAANLNTEGFISPDGQPWTADSLVEIIKTGQGRNIFTPEKQDVMINRQIRSQENDWIEEQLTKLNEKEIDAGRIADSRNDLHALTLEEINAQGFDYAEDTALKEIDAVYSELFQGKKSVPKDMGGRENPSATLTRRR